MPDQVSQSGATVYDAACVAGVANQMPGACPWCSSGSSATFHNGACPRVKAIEYHSNGAVKRVEFHSVGAEAAQSTNRWQP